VVRTANDVGGSQVTTRVEGSIVLNTDGIGINLNSEQINLNAINKTKMQWQKMCYMSYF
jgi:hypothetical protein